MTATLSTEAALQAALLDRLRALAAENGAKAREWSAKGHHHLAGWYQGQREAYLKVLAMLVQFESTAEAA